MLLFYGQDYGLNNDYLYLISHSRTNIGGLPLVGEILIRFYICIEGGFDLYRLGGQSRQGLEVCFCSTQTDKWDIILQNHHQLPASSATAFLASSSSCATRSLSCSDSLSSLSFSNTTRSSTVTSLLLTLTRCGNKQQASFFRLSPSQSETGFWRMLMPVTWVSIFLSSSSLVSWFSRRLRQAREMRLGKGMQRAAILLLRTDSLTREGQFSSPRMSVSSFSHTYNCFRLRRLTIPFSFRSLFFRSSRVSRVRCPFQVISLIQFSERLRLRSSGRARRERVLILLPERLSIWRWWRLSRANRSREGIWFLEALSQTRCSNPATREMSAMLLVLRSRYRISLKVSMRGKSRSSYFSGRLRRVQAMLRLLAVLPSPTSAPLRASSNFLTSSSTLSRASSSTFFRSSLLSRSSSCCCLSSSSSCSWVFSAGTSPTSSDILEVVLLIKSSNPSQNPVFQIKLPGQSLSPREPQPQSCLQPGDPHPPTSLVLSNELIIHFFSLQSQQGFCKGLPPSTSIIST